MIKHFHLPFYKHYCTLQWISLLTIRTKQKHEIEKDREVIQKWDVHEEQVSQWSLKS